MKINLANMLYKGILKIIQKNIKKIYFFVDNLEE